MESTLTLYHGTIHDFTVIDVTKGKPYKDFGLGFYVTEIYDHAYNLAVRNRKIEESRADAASVKSRFQTYVYTYKLDLQELDALNVKRFGTADREWIEFVIANRTNKETQHTYDVVIGPTANDDTRTSIRTVMNAANGNVLSDTALDLLLALLEPDKLPIQYYFGTNSAAKLLQYKERHTV